MYIYFNKRESLCVHYYVCHDITLLNPEYSCYCTMVCYFPNPRQVHTCTLVERCQVHSISGRSSYTLSIVPLPCPDMMRCNNLEGLLICVKVIIKRRHLFSELFNYQISDQWSVMNRLYNQESLLSYFQCQSKHYKRVICVSQNLY